MKKFALALLAASTADAVARKLRAAREKQLQVGCSIQARIRRPIVLI